MRFIHFIHICANTSVYINGDGGEIEEKNKQDKTRTKVEGFHTIETFEKLFLGTKSNQDENETV